MANNPTGSAKNAGQEPQPVREAAVPAAVPSSPPAAVVEQKPAPAAPPSPAPAEAPAAAPAAPEREPEPPVALADFCAGLSQSVRSPTLVSAFHGDEEREGRLRDDADAYRERFEAFRARPAGRRG